MPLTFQIMISVRVHRNETFSAFRHLVRPVLLCFCARKQALVVLRVEAVTYTTIVISLFSSYTTVFLFDSGELCVI